MIQRSLSAVVLLALLALPRPLAAQEARPRRDSSERDPHIERKRRAYALMQEGSSRFDLGKFDEAIDLFEKAFEVYPYPEALYSMAQAYRMKKDYEHAVFFYKSYLRNEPGAPNRAAVEARIEEMERLDAEQKASATKPPQGTREPPRPDGATEPPAPVSEPRPLIQPVAPAGAPWYRDRWGWALTGGGALALAGGALLLPGAYRLEHDYLPPGDQLRQNEERADKRNKIIGWSLVGVGGVALLAGVVKLAIDDTPVSERQARRRGYDLVIGPDWIGVAGTF